MEKDTKVTKHSMSLLAKIKKGLFSTPKKTIITIIIIVALGFIGWLLLGQKSKQPQYQTATVTRGTLITTVSESGNVTSSSQAGVGSPTTGIVTDIYVKDGDTVTKAQNLFKVASTATAQEIASAYASYLSAQNTLDTAKSKMNSLQAALFKANQTFLSDRGVANPSDQQKADPVYIEENAAWLQAESDYNNQSVAISQAQAALNDAALAYQATQDSVITAPISGTVANIVVKTGDQVTASGGNLSSNITSSSSTSTNNAILYIGNYSNPYIKVQASEVDITNIQAGQKATITLSAFPNETFVGKVDQVDTAGTISSSVVTYNVFVTFISPPSNIKPGMSATVAIQTARKDDVLSVPSSAVQTTAGQLSVRVLENGKINIVTVETGINSDTDTEITSGLSEGQTVVTGVIQSGQSTGAGSSPFSGFRGFGGFGGGGGGGGARGGAGR